MKIKLLVATGDNDYAEHLSNVVSEKFTNTFDISVCSLPGHFKDLVKDIRFDVALFEPALAESVNLGMVQLPIILCDESSIVSDAYERIQKIRKHQRISTMMGEIMQIYAEIGARSNGLNTGKANIIAVWSPCGGVGKTSVALAYAARRVIDGKHVLYLNLENFSSSSAFFSDTGRSISTVFEKLESNADMLFMGIRQQDSKSGITYFCGPDNYDDMHILTADDVEKTIDACSTGTDELVIDLSCYCGESTKKAFELADTVLLVCDPSPISQAKLKQFINQHYIFQSIQAKSVLINNKEANMAEGANLKSILLPRVPSTNPVLVYKTLAVNRFEW